MTFMVMSEVNMKSPKKGFFLILVVEIVEQIGCLHVTTCGYHKMASARSSRSTSKFHLDVGFGCR